MFFLHMHFLLVLSSKIKHSDFVVTHRYFCVEKMIIFNVLQLWPKVLAVTQINSLYTCHLFARKSLRILLYP